MHATLCGDKTFVRLAARTGALSESRRIKLFADLKRIDRLAALGVRSFPVGVFTKL